MPSSQHYHISKIMDLIILVNPMSILDVGTGFGKYGVLCREYLELWDGRHSYSQFLRRIDGVEVFEEYITPLHKFVYNNIYVSDIINILDNIESRYDLVLLIDVLEHFEKRQGETVLRKILSKNGGALISTPKNPSSQKDAFNNVYETHRSKWAKRDLQSIAPSLFVDDKVSHIVYLGNDREVTKLKRKVLMKKVNEVPGMSFAINRTDRLMKKIERMKKPN
jgi:2-polyprenyl-3-methyl-5-hydroxy-6-metoxy-1,4-benzoquinol methylase